MEEITTLLSTRSNNKILHAEIMLPCNDLEQTLKFYTDDLGFLVDSIFPADNPLIAVISGYGIRLRLQIGLEISPGCIRLEGSGKFPESVTAPNGTVIEFVDFDRPIKLPEENQSFVLTPMDKNSAWHVGRAGMRYRDLIPNRQGGRFIASHIQIPDAGPVADYVHFHKIRFQMIYCYKGWVRLVYEDQGPEFILKAGDCVLQPPQIRHCVLESSAGMEVVEIGCPAEHETHADHQMLLPTGKDLPEKQYGGQNFVRHQAELAEWQSWRVEGFVARDIGIGHATKGLVGAYVIKYSKTCPPVLLCHNNEFLFIFILEGKLDLYCEPHSNTTLKAGDSFVIPAKATHSFKALTSDLELLEVRLSANFETTLIDKAGQ